MILVAVRPRPETDKLVSMKKAPELTEAFLRQPSSYLVGCEKRALRPLTTGSVGVQERTESKHLAIFCKVTHMCGICARTE